MLIIRSQQNFWKSFRPCQKANSSALKLRWEFRFYGVRGAQGGLAKIKLY